MIAVDTIYDPAKRCQTCDLFVHHVLTMSQLNSDELCIQF
jgi:hypothetical protein